MLVNMVEKDMFNQLPPATMMRYLHSYFVRFTLCDFRPLHLMPSTITPQIKPDEAAKLTAEAYDTIGDYAIGAALVLISPDQAFFFRLTGKQRHKNSVRVSG